MSTLEGNGRLVLISAVFTALTVVASPLIAQTLDHQTTAGQVGIQTKPTDSLAHPGEAQLPQQPSTHLLSDKAQPVAVEEIINQSTLPERLKSTRYNPAALKAQVLLDRAYFSVGEIDGYYGGNMRKALVGYQAAHNMPVTGTLDQLTWNSLTHHDTAPVVGRYLISQEDLAGPFVPRILTKDMEEMAKLPCTCYTSPLEALGEKFHVSPKLLKKLNPGVRFVQAGTQITVPIPHGGPPVKRIARVEVSKRLTTVSAYDANGRLVAQYPATIGSQHDPLPIGDWKIKGVTRNPKYHYDPIHFWDADPNDSRVTVLPGPNNPVGVKWIALDAPHYGIHGAPEPSLIGKTYSHGCIRLTNWDVRDLSEMVHPGTPAILRE